MFIIGLKTLTMVYEMFIIGFKTLLMVHEMFIIGFTSLMMAFTNVYNQRKFGGRNFRVTDF